MNQKAQSTAEESLPKSTIQASKPPAIQEIKSARIAHPLSDVESNTLRLNANNE